MPGTRVSGILRLSSFLGWPRGHLVLMGAPLARRPATAPTFNRGGGGGSGGPGDGSDGFGVAGGGDAGGGSGGEGGCGGGGIGGVDREGGGDSEAGGGSVRVPPVATRWSGPSIHCTSAQVEHKR